MVLDFNKFVSKNYDLDEFCRFLAGTARANILSEMALGVGNVTRMPKFFDADDWKFLSQFPQDVWAEALQWRYNDGLLRLMQDAEHSGHIPEKRDWIDGLTFDVPYGRGKKWIFGEPGSGKGHIWTGLTQLAHQLSDAQHSATTSGIGDTIPYWAGEGPQIHEIDPSENDPNSNRHSSKYKHGFYGFDISDPVQVTEDEIDKMSDEEIRALLPEKWAEVPLNSPELKEEITKKRDAMKETLKHTMAGFSVMQRNTATSGIGNWIKANALPEDMFTKAKKEGDEITDPITGQVLKVNYKSIGDYFHKKDIKSPDKFTSVPSIEKQITFRIFDPKTGKVSEPVSQNFSIPVLHTEPVTLPRVELSDSQAKQLLVRTSCETTGKRNKTCEKVRDLLQAYPNETLKDVIALLRKSGKEEDLDLASSMENDSEFRNARRFLDNWDLLTPEQRSTFKKKQYNLMQVAQARHAKSELESQGKDDQAYYAHPDRNEFYTIGYNPNEGTPNVPEFGLDKDKTNEFIEKYKSFIIKELLGHTATGGEGNTHYGDNSMLGSIIKGMKRSDKYPPAVIEAIKSGISTGDLLTFLVYMLLPWLGHPEYGVKDPEFGMLNGKHWDQIDPEENKKKRKEKVQWFLMSVAQYGSGDILSRRQRKRYGMAKVGEIGQTKTGQAFDISQDDKDKGASKNVVNKSVKRAYLNSKTMTADDKESTARASLKVHKDFSNVAAFMASRRNAILNKLSGNPMAKAELDKATQGFDAAMQTAISMFDDYLTKNPSASEEDAQKYVHANLQKTLASKYHNLYGDIATDNTAYENIFAQIKNATKLGLAAAGSETLKAQAQEVTDKFFEKLIDDGSAQAPMYDPLLKKYDLTSLHIEAPSLDPNPNFLINKFIKLFFPLPELDELAIRAVHMWGLKLYEQVLFHHDMDDLDQAFVAKAWNDAVSNSFAAVGGAKPATQQPTQQSQQPQQPQPIKVAAKPIKDLITQLDAFKTPSELAQTVNDLASRKNELIAMKKGQELEAMLKRIMAKIGSAWTPELYKAKNILSKLVAEIKLA